MLDMTTYVFGAGASRAAGYPLANELGNWLRDWAEHPTAHQMCRDSIQELFDIYGDLSNLEQILTELDDPRPGSRVAAHSPEMRGRLRLYLRVAISELFRTLERELAPLYERLAREKAHPGDVFVTFNYDVACERELKRSGLWEINDGYGFCLNSEAIPPSRVSVLKLHGSANWLESAFGGNTGFFRGGPNAFGSRPVIPKWVIEFFGYPPEVRDPEGSRIFGAMPAMIMPTLNKRFYEQTSGGRELESFWEDLWEQATHALKSSDEIVIVGYSMGAADEKARNLLLNAPTRHARIGIFCGTSTDSISNEFAARGYLNLYSYGKHLFEDYLGGCAASGRLFAM
jgi:hypothetical protein